MSLDIDQTLSLLKQVLSETQESPSPRLSRPLAENSEWIFLGHNPPEYYQSRREARDTWGDPQAIVTGNQDPTGQWIKTAPGTVHAQLNLSSPYLWPVYSVLWPGHRVYFKAVDGLVNPLDPYMLPAYSDQLCGYDRRGFSSSFLRSFTNSWGSGHFTGTHFFLHWKGGQPDVDLQRMLGYGSPEGWPKRVSYSHEMTSTSDLSHWAKVRTGQPGPDGQDEPYRPGTTYWPPEVPFVVPYFLRPLSLDPYSNLRGAYATLVSGEIHDIFSGRTQTWYAVSYFAGSADQVMSFRFDYRRASEFFKSCQPNSAMTWYTDYLAKRLHPQEAKFVIPSALPGSGPYVKGEPFSLAVKPVPEMTDPFTGLTYVEEDWYNLRPFVEAGTLRWYEANEDGTLREVTGDWERFPYKNIQGRRQILRSE